MNAGCELDILVAEKVMGHKVHKTVWGKQQQYYEYSLGKPDYYDDAGESKLFNPLPSYSEDISAAWEVVEHLQGRHPANTFRLDQDYEGLWHCTFTCMGSTVTEHNGGSAPHAVCLAALKAIL